MPVNANDVAVMAALQQNIQHIIYIIKENRTFDQILGDLTNGSNADAALAMYGKRVTPNFHAMAQNFVTLDNFFCSGEVSGDGWAWSTEGRESDHGVKSIPPNYADARRRRTTLKARTATSTWARRQHRHATRHWVALVSITRWPEC